MRVATFNIESLDVGTKAHVDLETRVAVLRPVLERLAADGPEERTLRLALGRRMGGRLPAFGPET